MRTEDERQRAAFQRAQEARQGGFLWGLIGFLAGAAVGQNLWAAASGTVLGVLWSARRQARKRTVGLDEELRRIDARLSRLESARPSDRALPIAEAPPETSFPVEAPSEDTLISVDDLHGASEPTPPGPPLSEPPPDPVASAAILPPLAPRAPDPFEKAVGFLRDLLLGGNTVVRVGVLVLLVGISLLSKWAVDHALFPVEARLVTASLIGVALTVVGYRLREARPGFGTTLQGGGVAALYLVVFFALRIFELVPVPLAFALFVAIAVGGGTLAVVQRSQPLVFIGSLGGFLAPILASTGQGNHVVLFGYYLVLNAAIAAVAWRQAWRPLNVLAFVCTYGVASVWGVLRYRPEHFATTEPFLLAYMVLFTVVALLFALRQPPRLAGLVDGTLVFGTPLVTLLAQARLVQGIELGMATSTAGFGLFYAALATWVWRRSADTLRQLTEAFLALAVVFGTIAIPLGLEDGLTTTLAWALEGAGLYWVGTRQHRRLPRYAGIGLQLMAAAAFIWGTEAAGFRARSGEFWVFANPRFLSCLGLALSGFFIARESYAARDGSARQEWWLTQALAGWALLWWAGGSLAEIDQFIETDYEVAGILVLIAASGIALERAANLSSWLPGRLLSVAALPAAVLALPLALDTQPHLLANGGFFAWPLVLCAVYAVLHNLEVCGVEWTRIAYAPALWLVSLVTALALGGLVERGVALDGDWALAAFGVALGGVLLAAHFAVERDVGAFGRLGQLHFGLGMGPVAACALLWSLFINASAQGEADPLPYLPLLNPADVSLALVAVAVITWWNRLLQRRPHIALDSWADLVGPVLGGLGFVWLNGLLVRSVHQWTDVTFRLEALWDSVALQVAFSIAWTLVALAGMLLSTRHGWRARWITFATLLGTVVVKLFVVDLSQLSTGAKIGTFLVVGVLLLVVGYLSPVPPSEETGGEDPGGDMTTTGADEGEKS
jgi:uncharacterized membrane protein